MTTTTLFLSVVFIVSALVCYSIGVWSEKLSGKLKGWHLIFFWIGFAADTSGTTLMGTLTSKFVFNVHGLTGIVAILLMFIHAIWATIVLIRKDENAAVNFHKFSIFVWSVWLIPFFTGLFLAMQR
ncbi:MAG: TIGR03987 family protein [Anaerolineae bacterium]|nr:TIGR03987 family protein [Anaerolineae bacterium]